jgi:hypothetical protein
MTALADRSPAMDVPFVRVRGLGKSFGTQLV